MKKLSITLVQISAGTDVERNLGKIEDMAAGSPASDIIALPEVLSIRGEHDDYVNNAEPIPGPTTDRLAGMAAGRHSWILAGSVIERAEDVIYNTSVLINRDGNIAARYRKIHLFEANLDDGRVIRESDTYTSGAEPVLADIENWRCGLSICYDLRFPELFRHYAENGAHILFVPSNFTQRTGKDHWEVLLRARAIENQCFVVAPGQCGANPRTGIESHGHSMVIGPWGEILCRGGTEETVLVAELDPQQITDTRRRVPALKHRVL